MSPANVYTTLLKLPQPTPHPGNYIKMPFALNPRCILTKPFVYTEFQHYMLPQVNSSLIYTHVCACLAYIYTLIYIYAHLHTQTWFIKAAAKSNPT